jgi:hypothetical protein
MIVMLRFLTKYGPLIVLAAGLLSMVAWHVWTLYRKGGKEA